MEKVILNIGLNNNPKQAYQVAKIARERLGMDRATWATTMGEYLQSDEPTLVLHGETAVAFHEIVNKIANLSTELTQECIAVKIGSRGRLIYAPDYKGERYNFDEKYFIKILAQ
jgi:hypothetical protein